MWLIDVKTRELVRFMDSRQVAGKYAILSHTWEEDELNFSDGQNLASQSASQSIARRKKGYAKVDFTCIQAEADELRYVWVDTCCINQDSSAELSEAINSMFRWYQNARICYVYLTDTTDNITRTPRVGYLDGDLPPRVEAEEDFGKCRWFTRGWTLQELLAPSDVRFYAKDWTFIGNKTSLDNVLQNITGISSNIFSNPNAIWSCSISERMSWAADRSTTREEDSAYCLLGMFNVNIPLLYGEGPKAFLRLQEEILRTYLDHSLLSWKMMLPDHRNELLAPHVSCFKGAVPLSSDVDVYDYDGHQLTSKGLSISLPTRPCGDSKLEIYAALNLSATMGAEDGYAVLLLRRISREDHNNRMSAKRAITYEVVRDRQEIIQPQSLWHDSNWRAEVSIETVVIVPHRVSTTVCFDYPEDQLEITGVYPEHCFIRRLAEFHLVPDRKIPNSTALRTNCPVKLSDKVTGESRYLYVYSSEARTHNIWDPLYLHFHHSDSSFPPISTSPISVWSLKKGAAIFCARSWEREDIPPGVYVIRILDISKAENYHWDFRKRAIRSDLSSPSVSLLPRWNRPGTVEEEPMDTEIRMNLVF